MRPMASRSCSSEYAYEMRTKPSPLCPNAVPGTTATFSSVSSFVQNSSEDMPNFEMFGKI